MTSDIRRRRALLLPLVFVVFGWAFTSTPGASTQAADKTIFVSVLDNDNKPVKDIGATEFGIREDTVVREVTSVKPATQPLFITVLADTSKVTGGGGFSAGSTELIRDIRTSLISFVRQIAAASPQSQMSLMEFGQAAVTITNFTSKTADLEKGINRLFPKQDAPSVLLEAIVEAAKNLGKKESLRRAIIVLNVEPSDEQSREPGQKIVDELRKSGAQLWAVSLQKGALRNPQRDVVLEVITKNTGGRREFIVGQSAVEAILKSYADALTSQYEITYKRPAGAPPQNVQVGVARPGLKLFATTWPPQ
jgi:von Willebrand factor type A domain-containing protein